MKTYEMFFSYYIEAENEDDAYEKASDRFDGLRLRDFQVYQINSKITEAQEND